MCRNSHNAMAFKGEIRVYSLFDGLEARSPGILQKSDWFHNGNNRDKFPAFHMR